MISHQQKAHNSVCVALAAADLIAELASQAHFERRLAGDYLTQPDVGAWFDEVGFYSAFRSSDKNKVDHLKE